MTNLNQNTQALDAQDQALMDDLFSEFALGDDEIDLDLSSEPQMVEQAVAETFSEADLALQAEALKYVEAEAIALEQAQQDPSDLNQEDLDALNDADLEALDGLDLDPNLDLEEPVAQEQTKKASFAPKFDEGEDEAPVEKKTKKVKPKASSGSDRVTYYNSSKSTVLLDRLGGNRDLIILEAGDIDLDSDALKAKRQHLLDALNQQPITINDKGDPVKADSANGTTVQKKVAEKVIQLFTYLNKGGALNKVMHIAFETLLKDGHLSMKKGGNMQTALEQNGYKDGTVRAQTGQIRQLFPLLKIATFENEQLVPNPQSIILAKIGSEINV